jgi:hypothetical protein
VERLGVAVRLTLDGNLRVVDAREVAGTSGLVLLGLERERVRVHTGVRRASVVLEGLDLVEVLAILLLETVLTVENKLEGVEGTDRLLGEVDGGTVSADLKEGSTRQGGGHEAVGGGDGGHVGLNLNVLAVLGEVPQGVGVGGDVGHAPHELLDGVVVREANLLGGGTVNGVNTSVLDLLDQVLVTLLGVAATLLSVKVDVVGPHLEGIKVCAEIGRDVDVDTDLVVLERDQREIKTGVPVKEEEEGQVDLLAAHRGGGHLTIVRLLGLVEVKLGVQTPPLLVVLVDALTTNGKLNVVDGALGNPARSFGGDVGVRHELEVHVTDEVTITGDGHGHATGVRGSTVDGLLDVLHSEVGVALVLGLEESHLRVTGKVDILGTVSDELHETASHFESCCTISRENNFGQTRISRPRFFSVQYK